MSEEQLPDKGYFLKEGRIYRDGVEIGVYTADGIEMNPGFGNYALQAAKLVKRFREDGWLPDAPEQTEAPSVPEAPDLPEPPAMPEVPSVTEVPDRAIRTVGELVAAMQPYIGEPCPPMLPYLGDETPAVKEWIARNDDVRRAVLKKRNGVTA